MCVLGKYFEGSLTSTLSLETSREKHYNALHTKEGS